ncbi:MAG: LuxR C-terminal-related transcriptional regulator [Legionellales bacterium]
MATKYIEINEAYYFYQFRNGIKLVRPDEPVVYAPEHTLADIMKLPFSVYLLNQDGNTMKMNDEGADACGFDSPIQSVGKSLFDVSKEESAQKLIMNCSEVMQSNQVRLFEEINSRKDNLTQQFLSVKTPWYGADNNIIGVCGFSIVLGTHALAEGLSTITQLGLLQPKKPENNKLNGITLTRREIECLRLTVKGYTAKKTAKVLQISHRTIEEYLTNIRTKTGIKSKAELIEMALFQGI